MRLDAPEPDVDPAVDGRLVAAGVILLLAAGVAFVPMAVGVEISAALVAVALGGLAVAVARTLAAGRP